MGYVLRISIDILPHCLQDASFPGDLQSILNKSGMSSKNVELEITETTLMKDIKSTGEMLRSLFELGYMIFIDDFGTRFSSLKYLKELPVNTIKIDKSFVMDMKESISDAAIVQSVTQLAYALNYKVIAEGVENENTRQKLAEFDVEC